MIKLFPDTYGNHQVWTHWINESKKKKGRKSFPYDARWWLYFWRGCLSIEWYSGRKRPHLEFNIGEGDMPQMQFIVGIPFVILIFVTLEHPSLRRITPTVRVKIRKDEFWDMPVTKRIGFYIDDWKLWILQFVDSDSGDMPIAINMNLMDVLFGTEKYTETCKELHTVQIVMPEAVYKASVNLYTAEWKRPRWRRIVRIQRADIDVEGGIPIPSKGESSWYIGGDAVYSMTTMAKTVDDAIIAITASVNRTREKYGWKK